MTKDVFEFEKGSAKGVENIQLLEAVGRRCSSLNREGVFRCLPPPTVVEVSFLLSPEEKKISFNVTYKCFF